MIKEYLNEKRILIIEYCVFVFIFSLIFIIAHLELEYLLVGIESCGFLLIVYLVVGWINFKKQVQLKIENQKLRDQLQQAKNTIIAQRDDLQSYFMMWTHQMKTPITVSKLLLSSIPEETRSKLQLQLLYIEDYTNMAMSYLKIMNQASDMDITSIAIDDIIKNVVKKYATLFIHKHISLQYTPLGNEVIQMRNGYLF